MTERQRAILAYIRACEDAGEFPPTIREIMDELGISSSSVVSSNLDTLQEEGYIKRIPDKGRGIRLLEKGRRVNGSQEANILARVEAIRLRARKDILALGFAENEASVDVSLFGFDDMGIFHLAKELGWKATQSWYEPPVKTEGGEITIYYEPEEQVW